MLDNQIKPPKRPIRPFAFLPSAVILAFHTNIYMGTVAREPVTKSLILITYYEIGISPDKLHQQFRRGHNDPFADLLNLYLACEIKLSMPRSHVTAIPLVSSPQCA